MGILKLYDYIFYRIVFFYKKNYTDGSMFAGVVFLSIVQCYMVVAILNFTLIIVNKIIKEYDLILFILISAFFIFFNSIRYLKVRPYSVLDLEFDNVNDHRRQIKGIYVILYSVASLILYVLSGNV